MPKDVVITGHSIANNLKWDKHFGYIDPNGGMDPAKQSAWYVTNLLSYSLSKISNMADMRCLAIL